MKSMKCVCGAVAEHADNLKFNNVSIDGWVCKSCGEVFYNPEKAEQILMLNKLRKMKYHLKLSQVKSNLIVRTPKELGEALNLKKGGEIELGLRNSDEIVLHTMKSRN